MPPPRATLSSELYCRLLGLNMNGGGGSTSQIKIRLRLPGSRDAFFHYEHVLNTMLHELVSPCSLCCACK